MSDFSDIDGGEEPLFAAYEDEDLADPPPLPPPLAILNSSERVPTDPLTFDDGLRTGQDDVGFDLDQPFDTSRNESHDQSTSAAPAAKKRKPILTFNEGRLTSPKGLQAIVTDFPKVKFKGKGHEKADLTLLIKNYEEWGNRLFPRLAFDDFIERTEKLGAKKEVKALVNRLRTGTNPVDDELALQDELLAPPTISDTGQAGENYDDDCDLPEDHVDGHRGDIDDHDDCELPDELISYHDDGHHSDVDDNDYCDLPKNLDDGCHGDGDNHHNDCDLPDELLQGEGDHHGNGDAPADTMNRPIEQGMLDQATGNNDPDTKSTEGIELSVDSHDQVIINNDQEPQLLTVNSDKLDQGNSSCDNTSETNQDVPSIQRDTPIDQSEGVSMHEDDVPSDMADEMLQNSTDKLFDDTSVDDLFNNDL